MKGIAEYSQPQMATAKKVRVGVLGAGVWARHAHLPGYRRDARCEVVAIADPQIDLARDAAREFDIPVATADAHDLFGRDDIDAIDVCTPSATHFELAWAALEAGKHVLCEKPVAYDFRDTLRARDLARSKGLKTKVGLTFRYSPAMRYMRELVADGFVGTPFHLQRLRAELAVARSGDPAAAGGSRRRPVGPPGVLARGLRRADHRPRAPDGRAAISRRSSARCATSSRSGWCARPAA